MKPRTRKELLKPKTVNLSERSRFTIIQPDYIAMRKAELKAELTDKHINDRRDKMKKYKIYYEAVAYVMADSEDEALEAFECGDVLDQDEDTTVQEIDEFPVDYD